MKVNNKGKIIYSEEDLKALKKSIEYVKNLDWNNQKKLKTKKAINKKAA